MNNLHVMSQYEKVANSYPKPSKDPGHKTWKKSKQRCLYIHYTSTQVLEMMHSFFSTMNVFSVMYESILVANSAKDPKINAKVQCITYLFLKSMAVYLRY